MANGGELQCLCIECLPRYISRLVHGIMGKSLTPPSTCGSTSFYRGHVANLGPPYTLKSVSLSFTGFRAIALRLRMHSEWSLPLSLPFVRCAPIPEIVMRNLHASPIVAPTNARQTKSHVSPTADACSICAVHRAQAMVPPRNVSALRALTPPMSRPSATCAASPSPTATTGTTAPPVATSVRAR